MENFFVYDFITGTGTGITVYFFKTLQTLISQEDSFDFLDVKETWAGTAAKPSGVTL